MKGQERLRSARLGVCKGRGVGPPPSDVGEKRKPRRGWWTLCAALRAQGPCPPVEPGPRGLTHQMLLPSVACGRGVCVCETEGVCVAGRGTDTGKEPLEPRFPP